MKLSDKKFQNAIKKMSFKAGPELDKDLWAETSRTHKEFHSILTTSDKYNLWRIIMKTNIYKLAAAAVIIIACSISLIFWRSTESGIALADVLTRIEQVTAYTYQMSATKANEHTTDEWKSKVLVSQDDGIKMIQTRTDPNSGEIRHDEIYLLPSENTLLIVLHKEKNIHRIKFEDAELDYYKEEYNEPHTIIKQILSCEHNSIGQSVIDGITVEGFQTSDLAYKGGFLGASDLIVGGLEKVDIKLWVDADTFLPIRFEEDVVTNNGTHFHEVSYDFQWDVIINDNDFEPNISDDYTSPTGDFIIPVINEENAIKGLRIFANYAGNYPVILDLDILNKEANKYLEPDSVSYEELSESEKTKQNSELFTMRTSVAFYNDLVDESKEPAYYGETVEPGDSSKVLLRWKLDDGQYRVIFGDLSAKTVTAEELAELEK